MRVDAVLPAGGRLTGPFAAEAGADVKALIRLGGSTVLGHTLAAVRATGRIGRAVVVGPPSLAQHPDACMADGIVPEGATGPDNVFRGLEWLARAGGSDRVLVLATDLPFVTAEALGDFLDRCPADADLCVPVVDRKTFERRFPASPNTYVRLRDGQWTVSCAFLVTPSALLAARAKVDRMFAARKSQLAMARLLGAGFVLELALGRLGVEDVAGRVREVLGCSGAAVRGAAPELAFDIDQPAEYRYALQRAAGGLPPVSAG